MVLPGWLADGVAKLLQRAPRGSRLPPEVAFADLPATTEEIAVPTRHGTLRAIQYSPPSGAAGRGVYLNLHGGGFVIRHPEQDDALCRFMAFHAGVTVINLDYIPAPQSRFPGPVEQVYDVATWVASPERPWDGSKLALGGQSAGGALAAAAARLAFEEGGRPEVLLQVLMYPALDLSIPAARKWSPGQEKFLVRMGPVFNSAYCPDVRLRADRLASPAGVKDTAPLAGIAPALVISAEHDVLRDEAARYAQRLRAEDALIDHLDLHGVGHAFNMGGAGREVVEPVYEKIAESVKAAFA
ncbi:carboxylesterase [Nesterenkonia sp. AN1]|uniref:Acetyl esterase/lipase n=1 Tax=Nesterenkonia aurantiaca TaxID=1436010 RepID=A0A4R7G4D6_9MICC|nr:MULTISPECIES: alpha/beta hydrolase fold domain-containing protein [Nesterenkonia]EXF24531.1 carboxylesterase [Nesterenkonia sp. AN1]TDS86179.1 acetyl esterase/lipase [Nesterenkonia aurantiaca]